MSAAPTAELPLTYWQWFTRGRNGRPGWRKFFDRWLVLHAGVGVFLGVGLPVTAVEAARSVLLPLAGVFVGMSFAWVGNAQAILQSQEIERLAEEHPGKLEQYVYTYQSAILAILVTLVAWGIAALGAVDAPCPWLCPSWVYDMMKSFLYSLASLTLRECWHVVMGAQMLLLTQRFVRRLPKADSSEEQ